MSAPIGPGDWVEFAPGPNCQPEHIHISGLTPGAIYSVARVFETIAGHPALDLNEVPPFKGDRHRGFSVKAFRPIYRPTRELIDSLAAPPKEAPIQQPETVGGSAGFGPRVAARLVPGET